jgi:hypothetical protein
MPREPRPEHTALEEDRVFVMHTERPRFVLEFVGETEGNLRLIDQSDDEAELLKLRQQARSYFLTA